MRTIAILISALVLTACVDNMVKIDESTIYEPGNFCMIALRPDTAPKVITQQALKCADEHSKYQKTQAAR